MKEHGKGIRLLRDYPEVSTDIRTYDSNLYEGSTPIYTQEPYSYSQVLYPASVLGDIKTIHKISWFADLGVNINSESDNGKYI